MVKADSEKKAGKRIKTWHLKMVSTKTNSALRNWHVFSNFFFKIKLNSTLLADFNFQLEIGCWFWQYAIFSQIILYRGQKTKDYIFVLFCQNPPKKHIKNSKPHSIIFLHFLFFVLTHPTLLLLQFLLCVVIGCLKIRAWLRRRIC